MAKSYLEGDVNPEEHIHKKDVEEAVRGGDGLVVLLHAVVGAPDLASVGRGEKGCVAGAVELVAVNEEGLRVLLPVREEPNPLSS